MRRRPAAGLANDAHGFDEVDDLPLIIANRRRLDIDMFLAARRVMQVENALRRAGFKTLPERTGFASLVTRHIEMVRNLVTQAPGNRLAAGKLTQIGGIRGDNAVIRIHHNARLGQAVQEGK